MPGSRRRPSMCGYLLVEEGKSFNRRFCYIDAATNEIRICTEDPERMPEKCDEIGTINLQYVSMASASSNTKQKYENSFIITAVGEEYVFKASDADEMERWIQSINNESRITVPKESVTNRRSGEHGEISYKMEVVGGVLHKTPVNSATESQIFQPPVSSSGESDGEEDVLPATTPEDPAIIIKQGYAIKQGVFRKNWKRRFFVLDSQHMSYYANEQTPKPLRQIPLDSILEARPSFGIHTARTHILEVVTKLRVFYMQVDDEETMQSWISAINDLVKQPEDTVGKHVEVQTTDTLRRSNSLQPRENSQGSLRRNVLLQPRGNSQNAACQVTDMPELARMRPSVQKPLPNRTVQSFSTYL